MRLFSESKSSKKKRLTAKLDKKPITHEITFEYLDNPEYPDETAGTAIELDGRYLESPSEEKASKIFPKLPFQAIIVYLDIISLVNLGMMQKSMYPHLLSPQCLFAFNQVYKNSVLSYPAAYRKLKNYIESYYCNLITDEKQEKATEIGKLPLYKAGSAFVHPRSSGPGKERLNKFLQDIYKMQNMPEAEKEGCVILLHYIESVIVARQGDRFPQMLADAVKSGLFLVSSTVPERNIKILEGEQARHAIQVIASVTAIANAHSRRGLKKLQDVGDAISDGLGRMTSGEMSDNSFIDSAGLFP